MDTNTVPAWKKLTKYSHSDCTVFTRCGFDFTAHSLSGISHDGPSLAGTERFFPGHSSRDIMDLV